MSEQPEPDPSCEVCGRRLLPGERPTLFVTRDGAEAMVCELCKSRAEASGWLRPEEAEAARAAGQPRERRRSRGQRLGGFLGRLPASINGEPAGASPAIDESRAEGRTRRRPPAPEGGAGNEPALGRPPAAAADGGSNGGGDGGITLAEALSAFNASDHRRTVKGLTRTLGAPRANGLAVRARGGLPGARLTVAWELTWYQWEVGRGRGGIEVRESRKGETIDQLRAADRSWNLMVDSDGTLEQRAAEVSTEDGA